MENRSDTPVAYTVAGDPNARVTSSTKRPAIGVGDKGVNLDFGQTDTVARIPVPPDFGVMLPYTLYFPGSASEIALSDDLTVAQLEWGVVKEDDPTKMIVFAKQTIKKKTVYIVKQDLMDYYLKAWKLGKFAS